MKKCLSTLLLPLLVFLFLTCDGDAQSLQEVKLASSGLSAVAGPFWVAKEGGHFQRQGLDLQIIYIAGGTRVAMVLLSGQVQIGWTGSGPAISAIGSGGDLVMIMSLMPTLPWHLVAAPEVRSVSDLRGRKIGIATFGDTTDFAVRFALSKAGLDSDKDVAFVQVGGPPTRLAALRSGAVAGTVLGVPESLEAEKLGYRLISDVQALGLKYDYGTIAVTRRLAKEQGDLLLRFARGYVSGIQHYKRDREFSLKVMSRYLKGADISSLQLAYEYYKKALPVHPYVTREGTEPVLQSLKPKRPALASVKLADIIDNSFVAAVEKESK
ncbi:MAG: NrtA/SsuA/CpmA family ABC transporter substrate-binding protein [Deltaproteobacteria bacterium]|nr:NrtA/SsuA/CpmA family ABC transporter substrate-binding protein [Deltaproteobacteria bacterium]